MIRVSSGAGVPKEPSFPRAGVPRVAGGPRAAEDYRATGRPQSLGTGPPQRRCTIRAGGHSRLGEGMLHLPAWTVGRDRCTEPLRTAPTVG
ncbi:Uncharacterised protein [Mycobacteroides abscessus subsp. abscessus]|nr:Uncharacterised protein [Mycobacteroides abscessus subsp. abscessus]